MTKDKKIKSDILPNRKRLGKVVGRWNRLYLPTKRKRTTKRKIYSRGVKKSLIY